MNPSNQPQSMNDQEKTTHTTFEQQLQSLIPKASETSQAEAMYACGFRAGRESALSEISVADSTQAVSTQGEVAWRPLVLAACIACLLVGPAGYWLGQLKSTEREEVVLASDSRREPNLVPATDSQPTPAPLDVPVIAAESQTPGGLNEQLAVLSLPSFWETLARFSGYQRPVKSSQQQYLTTRSATNMQSVLNQLDVASTRNVAADVVEGFSGAGTRPGESSVVMKPSKISSQKQLRHLDGFRTPFSNRESAADLM